MILICRIATLLLLLAFEETLSGKSPQDTELLAPVEVQAEIASRDESDPADLVVVNLRNRTAVDITDLKVGIESANGSSEEKRVGTLKSGQTWADHFAMSKIESNPYLMVHYKWNSQDHSVARALSRPSLPKTSMLPVLLPVASSLVGAILGAWLVSVFTEKRERSRARFEWSKMLFEKYERSYREFLRNWGESIVPMVLQTQFETLESTSLIPDSIQEAYKRTLSTLSNDKNSDAEKKQAASILRQTVAKFMEQPWTRQD